MTSAKLRVLAWDKSRAWTDNIAHTRGMLVGMLRESTPMTQTEAKRLIRALLAGKASELQLADSRFYNSMRHALQSIGAEVEVVELATQQLVQADRPEEAGPSA